MAMANDSTLSEISKFVPVSSGTKPTVEELKAVVQAILLAKSVLLKLAEMIPVALLYDTTGISGQYLQQKVL